MCIIAYIPPQINIDDDTIENMFFNNPDGAGIMYKLHKRSRVKIIKGFDDVDDLIKAFRSIPETAERAIHCRIATAGKISVGCCHPFPVRNDTRKMTQAKDESPIAFMHNGIIDWCNPKGNHMNALESDTMIFGRDVLYKLKSSLDDSHIKDLIEEAIYGSKLLIFRNDGDTIRIGEWVKDSNGVMYSNKSYTSYYYAYDSNWRGLAADTKCNFTLNSYANPYSEYEDYLLTSDYCMGDCDRCITYACSFNPSYSPNKNTQYKNANTFLCFNVKNDDVCDAVNKITAAATEKKFKILDIDMQTESNVTEIDVVIEGVDAYYVQDFGGIKPTDKERIL